MAEKDELKTQLVNLLGVYRKKWPGEASTVDRFSSFLNSEDPIQGKGNPRGHITASAWILSQDGQKVLLTHHRKLNIWVQLGGHTDEGEPWFEAALREAREESGLRELEPLDLGLFDIDIHTIPARKDTPEHLHYDLRFLFRADHGVPLNISSESHDLKWVPLDSLEEYTREESQFRMRRKTPRRQDWELPGNSPG